MNITTITARPATLPETSSLEHASPLQHASGRLLSATALEQAPAAAQRTAVGAQFEAVLVRQLLGKTLTSMVGSGEGTAATIYGDLLAETIAAQLAAGRGLGLGRILEAQLTPRGQIAPSASKPATHEPPMA